MRPRAGNGHSPLRGTRRAARTLALTGLAAGFVCASAFPWRSGNTWHAYPDGTLVGPEGPRNERGGMHPNPVAWALSESAPGDVVVVHGDLYGDGRGSCKTLKLGDRVEQLGDFASKPSGALEGITIRGVEGARIGPIDLHQKAGLVRDLTFSDLTIVGTWNWCVIGAMGAEHDGFRFERCVFESLGSTKWGIRMHGPSRGLTVVDCFFAHFYEHGGYVDNAIDQVVWGSTFLENRRTAWQNVNRIDSGRSGGGLLLFGELFVRGTGQDGAGALTVTGHLGDVEIIDVDVESSQDTYGLVCSYEAPAPQKQKSGSYTDADGFALCTVRVWPGSRFVVPQAARVSGRSAVAVSSTAELLLGTGAYDAGPERTAIRLDVPDFGGGPVGAWELLSDEPPLAAWDWGRSRQKIVVGVRAASGAEVERHWRRPVPSDGESPGDDPGDDSGDDRGESP